MGPLPALAEDITGSLWKYRISGGETFTQIAEATGVGFVELRAANPGIDAWVPPSDTEILIPTQHILPQKRDPGLVINLGDMRLYFFDDQGVFQGSWPIGVGKAGRETPLGTYQVTELRRQPTWRPTDKMREENPELPAAVPPGPNNPLGPHAIRIGWNGYALHGTNKPAGVGRQVSSGCIRLYNNDIADIFSKVSVGIDVHIINQPIKLGRHKQSLFIEAHPGTAESDDMEAKGRIRPDTQPALIEGIRNQLGPDLAQKVDWAILESALRQRRGIPVKISDG